MNSVFARRCLWVRRRHYFRELSKPRRCRQRERHQTKGLMTKTMGVHVRHIGHFRYIRVELDSEA